MATGRLMRTAAPGGPIPPRPLTAEQTEDLVRRVRAAEDAIRAIGAGEVDAFVISDGGDRSSIFALETADRPYRRFVESMREGAATVSDGGMILYANEHLASLLGRERTSIIGTQLVEHLNGLPTYVSDGVDGTASGSYECDLRGLEGRIVSVLVGVAELVVDGERLSCLTFTDISVQKAQDREIHRLSAIQSQRLLDLQAAQSALTHLANHDHLTGLVNRGLLMERIAQALLRARFSHRYVVVAFVDVDDFKVVNDISGHAAGDVLLKEIADRLVRALRPTDTVARIGGDEFAVLAPEVDSWMHALEIGNRIVAELGVGSPGGISSSPEIAVSVGVAIAIDGSETAEGMLSESDAAMYHAKSLGGGRAHVYDAALGRRTRERAAAQNALQTALDDGRLVAHYQPIVDVPGRVLAGFEALARIRNRDGSILRPAQFIGVAESSGLVVPLGAQMLGLACSEATHLGVQADREGAQQLSVAVNVSGRQFEAGRLVRTVNEALELNRMEPSRLHLEITETAIIDLRPDVVRQLKELRDLGVQIGLDDFGTGYASLTHLRRLPIQFVKIDQTFVQGLGVDPEDDRIVAAVIDLASNLGLRSVAEGVETPGQLHRLQELGCDQAQGFLFSPPVGIGEVAHIKQLTHLGGHL